MNDSILEKYSEFFSPKASQVTRAIQSITPDQINPELSTLLVWVACFNGTATASTAAYKKWYSVHKDAIIIKENLWHYTGKVQQYVSISKLFLIVAHFPAHIFSSATFIELFKTRPKAVHSLPQGLITQLPNLPKIVFNPQCFPELLELKFNNISMEMIPEEVFEFRSLTHLHVCNCGLKSLSPKIAQLDQLKELVLKENQLQEIPREIHQSPDLQHLNVANNQLTQIDSLTYDKLSLGNLYFANNALIKLPQKIKRRHKSLNNWLKIYHQIAQWIEHAHNMPIEQWWESERIDTTTKHTFMLFLICCFDQTKLIERLPLDEDSRKLLDAQQGYRKFEKLLVMEVLVQHEIFDQTLFQQLCKIIIEIIHTHSLPQLAKQYRLELSITNLSPETLDSFVFTSQLLPYAREINASVLKNTSAAWTKNLRKITSLDLSNQQLSAIPQAIFSLTNLQELCLDNNNISSLPADIAKLSQLKTLTLNHNQLKIFPQEILDLPQLKTFEAAHNTIRHWYPMPLHQNLTTIKLSHNNLTILPQDFSSLPKLQTFDVSSNMLTSLPDSLGDLSQLKVLEINHNQIAKLPEYLGRMPMNEGIFDNPFFELPTSLIQEGSDRLKQMVSNLSLEESTQVFCLAYFSSQKEIRPIVYASLKKFDAAKKYPQWSLEHGQSFQVFLDFALNILRIDPWLHWPMLNTWIPYIYDHYQLKPTIDLLQTVLAFAKNPRKKVLVEHILGEWIQKFELTSTEKLSYTELTKLFMEVVRLDSSVEFDTLLQWASASDAMTLETVSATQYYEIILESSEYLNEQQRQALFSWEQLFKIAPSIDFSQLIRTLVQIAQENNTWNWQQFETLIEANKLKASKKLSLLQAFDLFTEVQQAAPQANWSRLHLWMEKTQALSRRKLGAKSYWKAILEATQSLPDDQWDQIDLWLSKLSIEVSRKMPFRQFIEQLITATKANPNLNWVLVTKWMHEAKAIQPRIERFELLRLLALVLVKMPDLDWSSLIPWLDHIEFEEDQEQGFLEFFHYLHDTDLLYKVNWKWMDTWMEKMQVRSQQKVKIKNLYLESIPSPIFKYWQNTSVDLSGNLLEAMPKGLEEMAQVKFLDLSKNLLNTLSINKIESLSSLKQLRLGFNFFKSFPEVLVHYPNLEYLDISHNQLSRSLLSQGKMPQLKTLNLSFNRFKKFPILFAEAFPKLEVLDLSFNHLTQITDQVAELEQLKVLNLSHNQLGKFAQKSTDRYRYALPLKISFLESLTHLYLQHNGLEKLPPGIGLMEDLQELDLSDNLLTEFPIEICEAEKLEVLNIAHNQISYIPAHLKEMPKLRQLNLSGNPLNAYEVKKVQNLLPQVEILFDTLVPPTFTPWIGKKTKRAAKNAYENGVTHRQRGYTQNALQSFRKAAMLDNTDAMMELGYLHEESASLQMAYWQRLAALNGHPLGQFEIGKHLHASQTSNLDQTVYWYTLAAQQGDLEAQLKLSYIYYEGEGMNENTFYSLYWLEKAAQQENIEAMALLAKTYEQGEIIPRDYVKAAKWYEKLAAQDQIFAQHKLAAFYRDGLGVEKDLAKVITLYEKLDAQQETIHFFTLGQGYYEGIGVNQNLGYAVYYFKKSAENDEIEGQMMMAKLHLEGEFVDKDYQKALKYLEIANSKGNAEAQRLLGQMYEQGLGCNVSLRTAVLFYEKAAKQGDVEAQYALGEILLQKHHEVGPDYDLAKQWLQDAADQGDERAKKRLGDIYANGWGVEKDEAKAGYWYSQVDSDLLAKLSD
ncbi:MAG TPA: hypothetical protein DCS93_15545 [Microscillaceae bacterium]|nr:hypothetical protein [Microscillaceae bacterium]